MGFRHGLEVGYTRALRLRFPADMLSFSYALNWLVTLPLELTAASITLSFWNGANSVNPAAWVVIFWFVVVLINFFGVRGYGEAEFVFSIIKVAAVSCFLPLEATNSFG
jgi:yeast amino acid transporter